MTIEKRIVNKDDFAVVSQFHFFFDTGLDLVFKILKDVSLLAGPRNEERNITSGLPRFFNLYLILIQ